MAPATERDVSRGTTLASPRSRRRKATRARLLSAAAEVLSERGFHGASVEEICERAGFTRGAFYSNFAAKDDLVLAPASWVTPRPGVAASAAASSMGSLAETMGSLAETPSSRPI